MRKQKQIWEYEHQTTGSLPSMASEKPSTAVVSFIDYLEKLKVNPPLKVVDIGSGKGRNAIYLAEKGYEVYAMDYIKTALDFARNQAEIKGVVDKIKFYKTEIDSSWPFDDNFFDIAVDCFSSIDIESREGREIYKSEMFRTLKPEGYALVSVVSVNDEWESKLIRESPGKEKNSTIWPQNGKFQKDYDEDELRKFYKEFNIIELKEIKKSAFKLGRQYTATNYWMVLRKPKQYEEILQNTTKIPPSM